MKFAKYLQDEVVPEWRKAYINYKQGKKHLKAIERVLDAPESEAIRALQEQEAHDALQDTLSPLTTLTRHHPQKQQGTDPPIPPTDSGSTVSTPIISRRRGSSRNYSSVNFLSPLGSPSTTHPTRLGPSISATLEEDQSALGGRTLYGDDGVDEQVEGATTAAVRPKKDQDGLRQSLGSTAVNLGKTARSQSSQLLKNLSRRFTIIGPSEIPVRVRSIQGKPPTIPLFSLSFSLAHIHHHIVPLIFFSFVLPPLVLACFFVLFFGRCFVCVRMHKP